MDPFHLGLGLLSWQFFSALALAAHAADTVPGLVLVFFV